MPTTDQYATPGLTIPAGTLISPSGPPGPQGESFVFKGTVTNSTQLPTTGNNVGDTYIDLSDNTAWVWDGLAWVNVGDALQGPPGTSFIFKGAVSNPTYLPPTGNNVGDLWYDQSSGDYYLWNGQNWTNVGSSLQAKTFTFKGSVINGSALPSTGNIVGDLYYDESTGYSWVWNGTAWINVGTSVQGPPGPPGPPGAGINIKGEVPTIGDLPTTGNSVGDVWIVQGIGYSWDGTQWISIGPIQGPPGPAGAAYDYTQTVFIVPAVGQSNTVTVTNPVWMVVGQFVWMANAGGSGLAGVLIVTGINGNVITLLNPSSEQLNAVDLISANSPNALVLGTDSLLYVPPGPGVATPAAAGLMNPVSSNATDYIGGDNASHNLAAAVQPTVWSVRLRSFNAIGNPNMEVDQRHVGNIVTTTALLTDRWESGLSGSGVAFSFQQMSGNVAVPGTNFLITSKFLRTTLTAQKTALAASDYMYFGQVIEGPYFRELLGDVHSVSILARSSVANLKFSYSIQDAPGAYTLAKLCSLGPTPNVWTLIPLPNLPLWPSGGTFSLTPGGEGATLNISLAAGSGNLVPANDTWQATTGWVAAGTPNFAANPVNSTFDLAFVQHEPGALCTPLIDKPFVQNYDECLRYFCKSYPYNATPGTPSIENYQMCFPYTGVAGWRTILIPTFFPKPMAKTPSMATWGVDGAPAGIGFYQDNMVFVGDWSVSQINATPTGFTYIVGPGVIPSSAYFGLFHWIADTGW